MKQEITTIKCNQCSNYKKCKGKVAKNSKQCKINRGLINDLFERKYKKDSIITTLYQKVKGGFRKVW